MPATIEPPKQHAAPLMDVGSVDPTPGPGDITSFEQARAAQPAATPAAVKEAPAAAPEVPENITVDPPDPNRPDQMPQAVLDDLLKAARGPAAKHPADVVKEEETPAEAAVAAKPAEAPAIPDPTDAEDEKVVQSFKTLKEVRAAHKEALKRERAWQKSEAEYKTRIEQAEAKIKEVDPVAFKAATEERETLRQRAEALEAKVRTLDYAQSTEFHTKFIEPQAKALQAAYADLNEMQVQEADGTTRKATEGDFKKLLGMDVQRAGQAAKEMFGEYAAAEVMAHRRQVVQLERAKREAVEGASKLAEEAYKKQSLEQSQRAEKLGTIYRQRATELEAKFGDLFKAREGDEEGNTLLNKGHELVQSLERNDIPDEDRVKVAAEVRYRAAGYGRLLRDYERVNKEYAALQAKLKGFEKSEPKPGVMPAGGQAAEPTDPMERSLRSIDKMATSRLI